MNNTALTVNTILGTFFKARKTIRPLKLQKLLYFICGVHYAETDSWLLEENDNFFVWPYGPVVVPVYYAFQDLSFRPINNYLKPSNQHTNSKIIATITKIIELYGDYDDLHLSNVTHEKGTPWEQTHSKKGLWSQIDRDLIKDYFKSHNA